MGFARDFQSFTSYISLRQGRWLPVKTEPVS